jgi:hypothetical protein
VKRVFVFLPILVVLASMLVGFSTAKLPVVYATVEITHGANPPNYTVYLNQQVELTALASGGAPPYTYQWTSIFIPNNLTNNGPLTLLDEHIVRAGIPDANNSKLNFTLTNVGVYIIKLKITDSEGNNGFADSPNIRVQIQPVPSAQPLNISFIAPENKTYATNSVYLNFTLENTYSKIAYSLDGQANQTITGNSTISGLTNGAHNMTVYVWDTAGDIGALETINFSIALPSLSPFSTVLVVEVFSAVVIVVVGLVVYFKKRKRSSVAS